jgi:cytochrome c556
MPATSPCTLGRVASPVLALLALGIAAVGVSAQERAAPPRFTDADFEPFFPDAREALVGERPMVADAANIGVQPADASADRGNVFRWSEIIDAEALDTEVKRIASRLTAPLASPAVFKSDGHDACRAEFAWLAALFAVIEDYEGEVRWQREAGALREAFARASANARVASDQSYAEATRRRDDLADVIRGARLGGDAAPSLEKWSALADRKLLMQRMQRALQEEVNPRLASDREFTGAAADVRQEAQVLALLAELICREDYEHWDDETFREYAQELGNAAASLSQAAADGNYEAARAAVGRASQSCAACHEGYRL